MTNSRITLPTDTNRVLNQRFKELGVEALSKVRVYLDTNFWVLLRNQMTGYRTSTLAQELLSAFRNGVDSNVLICTFSGHTLSEIMKHVDPNTQAATAQLMDELSRGFCLANQDRLLNNEIVHWMCGWMNPGMDRHVVTELAWAKPAYLLLDYVPPGNPGLRTAEQRLLHDSFTEHLWSMPMAQVMTHIQSSAQPYPSLDWPEAAANNINSEVRRYDHENSTREQLYLSELWGLVDWLGDMLVERYQEAATLWSKPMPQTAEEQQQCKRILQDAIMNLARVRSIAQALPSIHIRTALHTEIRWDKRRRFKANDLMDMEHTQTALPTCDFFFTDVPNAHLIRSAKLDSMFNCITTGDPQEALGHVLESLQVR